MTVAVILLAIVAVVALVVIGITARRLGAQRRLTAAAEQRATETSGELASTTAALETMTHERTASEERAVAAEEAVALAGEQAELAAQRSAAAEERAVGAEERAAAAERRAGELEAARSAEQNGGVDAAVLWALEQSRSERTWRTSVAPGADPTSTFTGATQPLIEALEIELSAAREEVGAVVELDADLPGELTPGGSLLVLRAVQELLAGVVRRAEETTVQLRADGLDVVIGVRAVDEDGAAVSPDGLAVPPSFDLEPTADGVRVRNALVPGTDAT